MPWRSPNRPRSDQRPGRESSGLTARGNLATLWRQQQRRLTLPGRQKLTAPEASASHLFEVRITAGPRAAAAAAATVPYPACGWPGACPGITGSAGMRIHISR